MLRTALLLLCFITFPSLINAQNIYTEDTWEARDKWQRVPDILKAIGLKSGDVIADIGSHRGYMTFKFSEKVGEGGQVFAVDVSNRQLTVLNELLETRKVKNVTTILGDYDDPKLPLKSLDYAFIMDAYHEMDDFEEILTHVKKALKPGGRLIIMEPVSDDRRGKSRSAQTDKHEIDMKYVEADLEAAGYEVLRKEDPFIDRTQKKHDKMWLLIAKVNPNN